jgi:hypothetical protein
MSLTCAKDAPYLFFQSLRGSALGIDVGSCKESQTADIDHHIVTDHHVLRNYPAECWDSLADSFFKGFPSSVLSPWTCAIWAFAPTFSGCGTFCNGF